MSVHNDRGIIDSSWLDVDDSMSAIHQSMINGGMAVSELSQDTAYQLIKWMIRKESNSSILPELRRCRFTREQEDNIQKLEQSYQTPTRNDRSDFSDPRGPSGDESISSVRRRLFEVEEEQEKESRLSTFKVVLVLGGAYIIYNAVVKPIFKQVKDYFKDKHLAV